MEDAQFQTGSSWSEQRYRILLEITNAIVSNLDCDALFKAIAREIQKATTFDRTGITLQHRRSTGPNNSPSATMSC